MWKLYLFSNLHLNNISLLRFVSFVFSTLLLGLLTPFPHLLLHKSTCIVRVPDEARSQVFAFFQTHAFKAQNVFQFWQCFEDSTDRGLPRSRYQLQVFLCPLVYFRSCAWKRASTPSEKLFHYLLPANNGKVLSDRGHHCVDSADS